MKYSILNCWTDKNKGDLGIVLSTVEEIRVQDENAKIIGISCYSDKDDLYRSEHRILRQYVDSVHPAIYGILIFKLGNFSTKNSFIKLILSIFETIRMIFSIILPKRISKVFLYDFERKTLEEIINSDVSIAKGGSVFTDYGNARGKFALFRMCMFYYLLKKYHCPYYILGQSFGPVNGVFSAWLVNKVISNSEKVYIRETVCLNYKNINFPKEKLRFSNDTAFLLKQEEIFDSRIDANDFNIGLTVRPTSSDIGAYVFAINETIKYSVDKYNAVFHIFPQVTGPNEPDEKTANIIFENLEDKYREKLIIYNDNFKPQQLKFLYGKMRIFIGTRLHSTIFALGAGTPSIGLVYHGTKAQGIFEQLNISEFILQDVSSERLIEKIENINQNYDAIKNIIISNLEIVKSQVVNSISEIIEDINSKNRFNREL